MEYLQGHGNRESEYVNARLHVTKEMKVSNCVTRHQPQYNSVDPEKAQIGQ